MSFSAWSICEPVNLITEANSPMQSIPVYDQGNNPSCYSYSASVLINYHALKKGYGQIAYPLWLAVQDAKNKNRDNLGGSDAFSAIENFKKQKYCSATVVQKAISDFSRKNNYPENKVISLINRKGEFTEADMERLRKCDVESIYGFFQGNNETLKTLTSADFFLRLILPKCHPTPVPALPKAVKNYPATSSIVEQAVNSRLAYKKNPIAIGFCSAALYNPNYSGLNITKNNAIPTDCGAHSSVLVGQKVLPGQGCGYLLRNSWGSGFNSSTRGIKCLCRNKKTKAYVDDCTSTTHNNGQWSVEACWYPSRQLSKSIYSLTTLE